MFDSLLYPLVEDLNNYIAMLANSECKSLPRAVETWMVPPDFIRIQNQIEQVKTYSGKNYSYGMFIAEAIDVSKVYINRQTGSSFNFSKMCVGGSQGFWGTNSCVPDFSNLEYRAYVRQIVADALDLGIQDILFGQVEMMDPGHIHAAQIVAEVREIAAAKSIPIIVGGQTGSYREPTYEKLFDYVIGPTRIAPSGEYLTGERCKATQTYSNLCDDLKWDPSSFSSTEANNVIMEFDWYSNDDDIHRFVRLTPEARARALIEARQKFIRPKRPGSAGFGMIMPFRIPLNGGLSRNGIASGCHGLNQYVYSPSSLYGCNDEDVINALLRGDTVTIPDARSALRITADNLILNLYGIILQRSPLSETPVDQDGFEYWVSAILTGQKACSQVIDDFVYTYNQQHPLSPITSAKYLPLCLAP